MADGASPQEARPADRTGRRAPLERFIDAVAWLSRLGGLAAGFSGATGAYAAGSGVIRLGLVGCGGGGEGIEQPAGSRANRAAGRQHFRHPPEPSEIRLPKGRTAESFLPLGRN